MKRNAPASNFCICHPTWLVVRQFAIYNLQFISSTSCPVVVEPLTKNWSIPLPRYGRYHDYSPRLSSVTSLFRIAKTHAPTVWDIRRFMSCFFESPSLFFFLLVSIDSFFGSCRPRPGRVRVGSTPSFKVLRLHPILDPLHKTHFPASRIIDIIKAIKAHAAPEPVHPLIGAAAGGHSSCDPPVVMGAQKP